MNKKWSNSEIFGTKNGRQNKKVLYYKKSPTTLEALKQTKLNKTIAVIKTLKFTTFLIASVSEDFLACFISSSIKSFRMSLENEGASF